MKMCIQSALFFLVLVPSSTHSESIIKNKFQKARREKFRVLYLIILYINPFYHRVFVLKNFNLSKITTLMFDFLNKNNYIYRRFKSDSF